MENETISKKELLDITSITYGQLYRWKRKKLIPDDWFIRKSTFTGQETYFPKKYILERIEKIKNLKDESSLDELANVFSPSLAQDHIHKNILLEHNIVSQSSYELLVQEIGNKDQFTLNEIISAYVFNNLISSGDVTLEEARSVFQLLINSSVHYPENKCNIFLVRKSGVSFVLTTSNTANTIFENNTKIIAHIDLLRSIEELKIKLKEK
ncbi:YhbD family protein [soil metagenome]